MFTQRLKAFKDLLRQGAQAAQPRPVAAVGLDVHANPIALGLTDVDELVSPVLPADAHVVRGGLASLPASEQMPLEQRSPEELSGLEQAILKLGALRSEIAELLPQLACQGTVHAWQYDRKPDTNLDDF